MCSEKLDHLRVFPLPLLCSHFLQPFLCCPHVPTLNSIKYVNEGCEVPPHQPKLLLVLILLIFLVLLQDLVWWRPICSYLHPIPYLSCQRYTLSPFSRSCVRPCKPYPIYLPLSGYCCPHASHLTRGYTYPPPQVLLLLILSLPVAHHN